MTDLAYEYEQEVYRVIPPSNRITVQLIHTILVDAPDTCIVIQLTADTVILVNLVLTQPLDNRTGRQGTGAQTPSAWMLLSPGTAL